MRIRSASGSERAQLEAVIGSDRFTVGVAFQARGYDASPLISRVGDRGMKDSVYI